MKYGSITFTGKSGEKYRFDAWSLETRFRALGAVYFVTKRMHENTTYTRASHDSIFIGHTPDLAGQYDTYSRSASFAKHGANCICILLLENEERRVAVANDLLDLHSTHCNNTAPWTKRVSADAMAVGADATTERAALLPLP
jgi:hypothetical protein